jgi:hypothetical protein
MCGAVVLVATLKRQPEGFGLPAPCPLEVRRTSHSVGGAGPFALPICEAQPTVPPSDVARYARSLPFRAAEETKEPGLWKLRPVFLSNP